MLLEFMEFSVQRLLISHMSTQLKMISPCLKISLNHCWFSILKWWGRCADLDSSNWWDACCFHPFSFLEIDSLQTDFLQKPFSYELATFLKRFPISSAATDFSFRLRWISLGNCWCRLRKKRTLIFLHNFLKIHVFTKSFSLPAIWTFGSWPDENNTFTSLWAYYDFSRGIRVGISLKKVVFICIFTIVLVILVEIPALSLTVVFVRTLPPLLPHDVVCVAGAFPKGLVSICCVFKNSTCQQLFRLFVSLHCFWYLLTKLLVKKIFFFGVTQTYFSTWVLLVWYFL